MAALVKFFQHPGVRRFSVFVVLTGVLYLFKSMINLILLTFIFTFLMDRLEFVVRRFVSRFFRVSQRVVITFLYVLLAVLLTVGGFVFYPIVAAQIQFSWLSRLNISRITRTPSLSLTRSQVFSETLISVHMSKKVSMWCIRIWQISAHSACRS